MRSVINERHNEVIIEIGIKTKGKMDVGIFTSSTVNQPSFFLCFPKQIVPFFFPKEKQQGYNKRIQQKGYNKDYNKIIKLFKVILIHLLGRLS